MRRNWTTKEVEELRNLYKKGFSAPEIARVLKRSYQSVNRALSRYDLRGEIKETQKEFFSVSAPMVSLGNTLLPLRYEKINPLSVSSQVQSLSYLSPLFPLSPKRKKLNIKIEKSQPVQSKEKHLYGALKEEITWAHAKTPLRILPVKKTAGLTFYYVRDLTNLDSKHYLTKVALLKLLNTHRKKMDLPLYLTP